MAALQESQEEEMLTSARKYILFTVALVTVALSNPTISLVPIHDFLLVADPNNDRVMAFDAATGDLLDGNFIPVDPVHLPRPVNSILSADGTQVLVSDRVLSLIQAFDAKIGLFVGTFAPVGGADPAILANIRDISLRPNGNLLVTVHGGANGGSVAEFDTDGNYMGNVVEAGDGVDRPYDEYYRSVEGG